MIGQSCFSYSISIGSCSDNWKCANDSICGIAASIVAGEAEREANAALKDSVSKGVSMSDMFGNAEFVRSVAQSRD